MTVQAVDYSMTSVADSCAPSGMIGMILSTYLSVCLSVPSTDVYRVRAKVQNFEEGYGLGPLAQALYAGYDGSTSCVEVGYLQSMMLIKVCLFLFVVTVLTTLSS